MAKLRSTASYDRWNHATIRCCDCLSFVQSLPKESVQLVVTSPPYNLGKSYERSRQTKEEYVNFQSAVIEECLRVLKPGGSLCWQTGHYINGHSQVVPIDMLLYPVFSQFEETHSLRLRNRIIWHFEHGLHCKKRFSGRHETILWYTKGDSYTFDVDPVRVPQKYPGKLAYQGPKKGKPSGNPLGKNPGDVWVFPNVKGNHVEKTLHPCQFPIELPERLILSLTKPGQLVLDPFLGVGTTAVAAILNSRRAAGADTCTEYIKVARERVKMAHQGKLRYRLRTTPVHSPKPNTSLTTPPPGFANSNRKSH